MCFSVKWSSKFFTAVGRIVYDRMEFYVGAKIQAKDSVGRWENGIIREILDNGEFMINYREWGMVEKSRHVRWPLEPRLKFSGKKYIIFVALCIEMREGVGALC